MCFTDLECVQVITATINTFKLSAHIACLCHNPIQLLWKQALLLSLHTTVKCNKSS